MFEKLVEENIIVSLSLNDENIENTDSYCEFMRDVILNTSGLN